MNRQIRIIDEGQDAGVGIIKDGRTNEHFSPINQVFEFQTGPCRTGTYRLGRDRFRRRFVEPGCGRSPARRL
jgi:hypothetical protein